MKINNKLLISLMAAHEMTMAELSRESGVSTKTIQLAVTNVQQSVSKDTIIKIARALNVDPIRLEGGKQ
ncbi:helix-turn-helix domain-containing protein [Massilioclostridium coli]|uniref:helix-turn-helix domain-containing protein n=1 Tax=Massilioclostridium coli TaxID=1870991 RepID=UPI00085CBF8C|nr:helix-turn-helix transcriptional regulator [Massilioclostridium coli]